MEKNLDRYVVHVIASDECPKVNIFRLDEESNEELIASYSDASEILDEMGEVILVDSRVFHSYQNK